MSAMSRTVTIALALGAIAAFPAGKDTPVDGAKGRDGNVWRRYAR